MSVIHKYKISVCLDTKTGEFFLPVGQTAKILAIQLQDGIPCAWVLEDKSPEEDLPNEGDGRRFRIFGTGQEIPMERGVTGQDRFTYVATFQVESAFSQLVWHVFEDHKTRN